MFTDPATDLEQLTFEGSDDGRGEQMSADRDWSFLRQADVPPDLGAGDDLAVIDLFAGCGGLTLGALEGARRGGRGASLALAVDHERAPLDVLEATLSERPGRYEETDLGEVLQPLDAAVTTEELHLLRDVGDGSLLVAGPPCQGHSALNNHTRHDDPRNDLYLAVARAAKLVRPKVVIVENVRGVGSDRRAAMSRCMEMLRGLGYKVDARRLDLHALGVAQKRVRHVLVAARDEPFEWNLARAGGRTVEWAIGDLLDADGATPLDCASKASPENQARIDWLFDNGEYDLPNPLRPVCHQSDHSYVSMYGRLRWDAPAQTITSGFGSMGQGRYVHPLRRRTITPHEAARLQFMPDFMAFDTCEMTRSEVSRAIGNVAPPLLAASLVEALIQQGLL